MFGMDMRKSLGLAMTFKLWPLRVAGQLEAESVHTTRLRASIIPL
jgi:hypothetical protein